MVPPHLGRVIGLAFRLPLIVFAVRGGDPCGYRCGWRRCFGLIFGQGAWAGTWFLGRRETDLRQMSATSGFGHLLTAPFLLGDLVWTARDLRPLAQDPVPRPGL